MSAVEHKVLHAMVGAISGGIAKPDDVAGGAASGAASGAVGAFTTTTVMALTGRAEKITKEALKTAAAQGRDLDQEFVQDLIDARLNDLMAFSSLTGAAVAHSLGLDPELAMEVGKRQAKENCYRALALACLNQYSCYLAVRSAIPEDFDERTTAYAKKIQDEEALKKAPSSSKKPAKGGSSSSGGGGGGGKKDDDHRKIEKKSAVQRASKERHIDERLADADRVGSGLKEDIRHRPASFATKNGEKYHQFNVKGNDGNPYTLYQKYGEVNGRKGVFEYLVNKKGEVTHQFFKIGRMIDGKPN